MPDDPWEALGPLPDRDAPVDTVEFARPASLPGVEVMTVLNSRRLCHVYHETYSVCALLDAGGGGPSGPTGAARTGRARAR